MELAVLLGAGASLPQMPSTRCITKELIDAFDSWVGDSAANRPFRKATEQPVSYTHDHHSRGSLAELKRLFEAVVLLSTDPMTFEEVYSIADQIRQHIDHEYDNNALEPTVYHLCRRLGTDWKPLDRLELKSKCRELLDLINCVVKTGVGGSAWYTAPDGFPAHNLQVVLDLLKQEIVTRLHLLTTNFDVLVEEALKEQAIVYYDGFGCTPEFGGQVVRWEADEHKFLTTGAVSLYKLHGSENWSWVYGNEPFPLFLGKIVGRITAYPNLDGVGGIHRLRDDNNLLLSGKTNKLLAYNQGWALDLAEAANRGMRMCQHLIVAGYGFSDEGINFRLIHWMSRCENRMLVIDPCFTNTLNVAKGAIQSRLTEWKQEGRMVAIEDPLGEVTDAALSEWLFD